MQHTSAKYFARLDRALSDTPRDGATFPNPLEFGDPLNFTSFMEDGGDEARVETLRIKGTVGIAQMHHIEDG